MGVPGICQAIGQQQFLPDTPTEIWGYNGTFPGPTIEACRGRPVVVTHRNELSVPTVVHLHGGVIPPEMDGYPVDYLAPTADPTLAQHARHGVAGLAVGSRDYIYANDQAAAMLWYHDHRMEFTGPQQYMGLAGFYLIRNDVEDSCLLPGGERDIMSTGSNSTRPHRAATVSRRSVATSGCCQNPLATTCSSSPRASATTSLSTSPAIGPAPGSC